MTTPTLPPQFQAVEKRLSQLQAQYASGELDAEAYQRSVQDLKTEDGEGRTWWLGGEAGAWHYWDGSAWVRAAPPGIALAERARAAMPGGQTGRPLLAGCGVGTLLVIILLVAFLAVGWQAYNQTALIVEGVEPGAEPVGAYALTQDQLHVIEEHGYPEAFALLFYEEEQIDGSMGDVRSESWSYYSAGLEFTFINGSLEAEEPLEIELLGELAMLPYRPEQFNAYMDLEAVIAAAGIETYMVIPLEAAYLEDGEIFYAEALTFGLLSDELLYLEALAVEIEG